MVAQSHHFPLKWRWQFLIILGANAKNRVILQLNSPILAKFSAVPVFPAISIPSTLMCCLLSYKRRKDL
jgi:hypothetical protein